MPSVDQALLSLN